MVRRWQALQGNTRGVLLVVMAMLCWSVLDACNKQLMAQGLVPKQVLFLQASIVLCMLMPVWVATKGRVVRSRKPLIHVLRAGFIVTSAWCAAYAVSHLPLAGASAFLTAITSSGLSSW